MRISRAEVTERFDIEQDQSFLALVEATGEEESIYFTTPFLGAVQGGMVGHVPTEGSVILCCIPEGASEWYYLGTTFERELSTDGPKMQDLEIPKSQRATDIGGGTGAGTGNPHRIVLQDDFGNGLSLYHEKRGKGDQNVKTELKSGKGKRLAMIDSANTDCIVLETAGVTGGKSRILMGDDDPKADSIPADSLEIFTTGPQKYINHSSQTDVVVYNGGKELQIINKATGENSAPGAHSGNVNIQSDNKDVNILALGKAGEQANIFIETLGGNQGDTVQITVAGDGTVRIKSGGKIELDCADNLEINCGSDVNMSCQNFNVTAGGSVNLNAASLINADGTAMFLQSGNSSNPGATVGNAENKYGSGGITTY